MYNQFIFYLNVKKNCIFNEPLKYFYLTFPNEDVNMLSHVTFTNRILHLHIKFYRKSINCNVCLFL